MPTPVTQNPVRRAAALGGRHPGGTHRVLRAARDLAEGARAPLESWQALRDAVRGTDEDGADALAETTAAAERLETALGDAGRAATGAGAAAGAAAASRPAKSSS